MYGFAAKPSVGKRVGIKTHPDKLKVKESWARQAPCETFPHTVKREHMC